MSTDVLRGTGSIRSSDGKEFVATIIYQLWEKPETESNNKEWWGSFTHDRLIKSGEYIIELEDGRKGTCHVRGRLQWTRGMATVYPHSFQGGGSLI
jgi:hypothetical protein